MPADLASRRLARLGITRPLSSPQAVLERLLAVQAQDLPGTLWAVALRCGCGRAEVERALDEGSIVRTWPMRGTLHLVPAAEARWMLELLGARALAAAAGRRKQLELDEAVLARCREHLVARLEGRRLTRSELMAELESIGVSTASQRGYHVLAHLCQEAVLCQAGAGKEASFALFHEHVGDSRSLPRDEALAELALRYFSGHGPATEEDLAWWAGLPLRDVRAGLEGAKDALVREAIDGKIYWSAGAEEPPEPGVHLLPGFDELLLGYRDRSAVLDPAHAERVCPGGNGVFRPTAVVEGRMVATWKVKVTRREARFSYEPFEEGFDPEVVRGAEARHAGFLGVPS